MTILSNATRLISGPLMVLFLVAGRSATAQNTFSPTPADSVQMLPSLPATPVSAVSTLAGPAATDSAATTVAATAPAAAPAATAMAPDTVVAAELRRLDEKWADATVRNDAETLSKLMTPDYVSINSKGQTLTRTDILQAIAHDRVKTTVNKGFGYLIKVFGDVGVVMHNTSFVGTLNGRDTSGDYRATSVFVRREGRWFLASSQSTAIAPPETKAAFSARR